MSNVDTNGFVLQVLIERTNLDISFFEFLQVLQDKYPAVGNVFQYEPIAEGYEDANIKLNTSTGIFVVKIFLKDRSKENILSYVEVLEECNKKGIPTIQLVRGQEGTLSSFSSEEKTTYFIVTEFFEGKNFQEIPPTIPEMVRIAEYLAKLNTLQLNVTECYDSWGNKNLLQEWSQNRSQLTTEQQAVIAPIVDRVKRIDLSHFSQSFIHGDLQRKHVLKNTMNELCLLDFGCMANGPKVIELSVFLAWFCLAEDTWKQKDEIQKQVIDAYTSRHNLTNSEKEAIVPLILGAYGAYYLATSLLINSGDTSAQTLDWHHKAKRMIELFEEAKMI